MQSVNIERQRQIKFKMDRFTISESCVICTENCYVEDASLYLLNEHQANCLCTVLNFEDTETETRHLLHGSICLSCQDKVEEVESLVEDLEILHEKIRAIATNLKRIMKTGALKRGNVSAPFPRHRGPDRHKKSEDMYFQNNMEDALNDLKAELEVKDKCYEDDRMPDSEFIFPLESVKVEFTEEELEKSDGEYEDPDWEPNHSPPSPEPKTNSVNLRRRRSKHADTAEEWSTYELESAEGPVKLKYAQLKMFRCDESIVKDDARFVRRRERLERLMSYRNTYKHLRQMAEKRQQQKQLQKQQNRSQGIVTRKMGRPAKYIPLLLPGKVVMCHFPRCCYESSDKDQLSGHYRGKHLKERHPFRCTYPSCEKAFTEFRRLAVHRPTHHGKFPFSCDHCKRKFLRNESYTHHLLVKHTENPPQFPCPHCSQTYPSQKSLRYHFRVVHGPKNFKCTINDCDRVYSTNGSLQSHQIHAHHTSFPQVRREPIMCAECGVTVQGKHAFKKHQLRHQGIVPEKPFTCSYLGCKYRAERPSVIRKHAISVHETTERKFACTLCESTFKHKSNLNGHIKRVHSATRQPVVTCPTCGVGLTTEAVLKNHIAIRHTTGNKSDFLCPRCQLGFPTKKYLRRHQLKYPNCEPKEPGPRAVNCEICEKSCSNKAGLRRHMHLLHNPELRPWECERCGKGFPIKMYLMRHQRESKSCVGRQNTKTDEPLAAAEVTPAPAPSLSTKPFTTGKSRRCMETSQARVPSLSEPTDYRLLTTAPSIFPSSSLGAISLLSSAYERQIPISQTSSQIPVPDFYFTLCGVNNPSSQI